MNRLAHVTDGTTTLLRRLLDDPGLVQTVQSLAPRELADLVARIGLEDAGEIVALATTEQLTRVFDEDLWRSQAPGVDETFDADRFVLWLRVLGEAGEPYLARRLAELDEDVVTLALHQQVLVLDLDSLAVQMADSHGNDDADQLDKALESALGLEFEEFQVVSRLPDNWDVVADALTALNHEHHDLLRRLLERLAHLTAAQADDAGGWAQLLTAAESLADHVAGERQDRRAQQGFIAPSAAASLLRLACTSDVQTLIQSPQSDPVTRAYFRAYAPPATARTPSSGLNDLIGASLVPRTSATPRVQALIARLVARGERPEVALAYLTNVLMAGCGHASGRRLRPIEAGQAVLALCERGLERATSEDLVRLFLVGVHRLHHEAATAGPVLQALRLPQVQRADDTAVVGRSR
jgi:hypothetical protein